MNETNPNQQSENATNADDRLVSDEDLHVDEFSVDDEATDVENDEIQEIEWPDSEEHRLSRLEAVLFLAREPLNSRKLSDLASLEDGTQARTLIRKLNQKYDQYARSYQVKKVAGGYQLLTRPQFSTWLRKLDYERKSVRLSTPTMETLAVVAYRQPVLKAEIEAIRGVSCGELLRQLMERNLVRISGRSPELGNPYLYSTTKRFLESFGLANLDALPRANKLRGQGIPDWSQADQNTDHQNSQSEPTDPSRESDFSTVNTNEEGSP